MRLVNTPIPLLRGMILAVLIKAPHPAPACISLELERVTLFVLALCGNHTHPYKDCQTIKRSPK